MELAFLLLLAFVAAIAAAYCFSDGPSFQEIDCEFKALSEVRSVLRQGYAIFFTRGRAVRGYEKWTFQAHLRGHPVGRLDVDRIGLRECLYVENIHVEEEHSRRGLATALLVCAALTTGCREVATSGRTTQGAVFFQCVQPVLNGRGIELRRGMPGIRAHRFPS